MSSYGNKTFVKNYKMDNEKRGMAIIFNHEHFDPRAEKRLKPRNGTQVDCNRLKDCLENLGFTVTVYQDLIFLDIYRELEKLSQKNHSENDCFLLAVLSHGEKGKLSAYDREYKYQDLWTPFYSSHCPTLNGKPKIFIIQGCQGKLFDRGVTLDNSINNNNNNNNVETWPNINVLNTEFVVGLGENKIDYFPFKPLGQPDFLIACSTTPDHYSFRNNVYGSWFIQELCEQLETNAYKHHLLELLTLVCNGVAIKYSSNVPHDDDFHNNKQVPFISHTLLRICQFSEKKKGKK